MGRFCAKNTDAKIFQNECDFNAVTLKCAKDSFSRKGVLFAKRTTLKCAKDFFATKRSFIFSKFSILCIEMLQKDK